MWSKLSMKYVCRYSNSTTMENQVSRTHSSNRGHNHHKVSRHQLQSKKQEIISAPKHCQRSAGKEGKGERTAAKTEGDTHQTSVSERNCCSARWVWGDDCCCLLVALRPSYMQGWVCIDNYTCCRTEIIIILIIIAFKGAVGDFFYNLLAVLWTVSNTYAHVKIMCNTLSAYHMQRVVCD